MAVAVLREGAPFATPEVWAEKLRLIHQSKREFQAR